MTDRNMTDKLAAFIELSGDAIVDATLDGIITGWNPAAEALYGYAHDEIIGRSILLLSPQERADEVGGVLAKVKAGQPVGTFESVRVRKDGTKVSVLLAISPVHGEHGPIIGVRAIVRDVSDRKRAEQEYRRMASIVEHANDAIVDVTLDGVITSWNPAAQRIFGVSSQEVIGKYLSLISPKERVGDLAAILAQVKAGQPTTAYESDCVRGDGARSVVSLTISPVRDADGVIVGISAIGRDVTYRKRAEQELRRMAAIVEHANDAIVDATTEGVITNWNPAAERMFGISRDEVIGKSFTFIEPSDRFDEIRDILAKIRTDQPVGSYESVRVREDGSEAHISLTISPVKDADGVIIGVSAIGRDVTREVRAKREIADWRSKAFKWMEEVERSQRLSVEREFERELLLIDLQQQLNDLRGQDPPERGTSE